MPKIKLIVEGGAMKPGTAVAQQIGPMGINMGKVIEDVNKETSGFKGLKVPVEIDVDPKTKTYEIVVMSPPMSELIKSELKIKKASGASGMTWVGNVSIEGIIKVAKTKQSTLVTRNLKNAVRLAIGSCTSMGILIDSKSPIEIGKMVAEGKYDKEISEESTEASPEKAKELADFYAGVKAKQDRDQKAEDVAKAAEEEKKAADVAKAAEEEKKEGEKKVEKKK